jgi:hypothetical protein
VQDEYVLAKILEQPGKEVKVGLAATRFLSCIKKYCASGGISTETLYPWRL